MANPFSFFGRGASRRAAQEAAENLGRAGVTTVEDLGGKINYLIGQGLKPEQIFQALALTGLGAGAIAAPAAASAGGLGTVALRGLAGLGTEIGAEAIANRLFGQQYVPASPQPTGRGFLTTTAEDLAYEQYAARENFNRALLNLLPGVDLPSIDPRQRLEQGAALRSKQLQEATQREIQKLQAEGGIKLGIQQLISQAAVESQRLASQAQVAAEREKSLGDIQRQRVESSYQSASDLLNQAIKDVVARERYENNTSLAELAKAV